MLQLSLRRRNGENFEYEWMEEMKNVIFVVYIDKHKSNEETQNEANFMLSRLL